MLQAETPIESEAQRPARSRWRRAAGRWDHLAGAIVTGGAVTVLLLLFRGTGFFATDDAIDEFLPYLHDIGRLYSSGQLPVLTAESFSGGNYLIDFHRTPYHPLTVLLALLLHGTGSIVLTSGVFAFAVIGATSFGAFGAARALGVSRLLSHAVAVAVATSPVMVFVYASAWWNGALATATLTFVVWAAFAVLRRPTARSVLGFVVASAFLFYSGWPIALAQYALFGVVVLVGLARRRSFGFAMTVPERRLRAVALIGSAAAAALLAVPQVGEYLADSSLLDRTSTISNDANRGVVNFLQLAGAAHPSSGDFWLSLGGDYQYWVLPVGFVSVLVALAVAAPTRWDDLRASPAPGLAATVVVLALLTQLPQRFGPLLYPFRSITAVGLFIALLAATVLMRSRGPWSRPRALTVAAGYVVLAGVFLLRIPHPLGADRALAAASAVLALAVVALLLLAVDERRRRLAIVAAAVLGPAYVLATVPPLHFQPATGLDAALSSAAHAEVPTASEGFLAQIGAGSNDAWPHYLASRYLIGGNAIFNGYDPVRQTDYATALSVDSAKGTLRVEAADYLASPSAIAGRCRADDLGIAAVTAVIDLSDASSDALVACGYAREDVGGTAVFSSARVAAAGGPTTWDEGLDVTVDTLADRRVDLTVDNGASTPARLNFSRMWWPGYSAELDGDPLEVSAVDGFSVQVTVPADASGSLRLEYRPRTPGWTLPVAGLGAVLAGAVAWFVSTGGRRRGPTAPPAIEEASR